MIRMEKGHLAVYDQARLDGERDAYQRWLDTQADEVYQLAEEAKAQGLDFSDEVEIPRTRDLASRTCLLYTSPSPRDQRGSRMPSSA